MGKADLHRKESRALLVTRNGARNEPRPAPRHSPAMVAPDPKFSD